MNMSVRRRPLYLNLVFGPNLGIIGKVANEVIHPDDIKVTFTGMQM